MRSVRRGGSAGSTARTVSSAVNATTARMLAACRQREARGRTTLTVVSDHSRAMLAARVRARVRHFGNCLGAQLHVASGPASVPPPAQPPRVLSIQSHIVHGNLGNKCAVFPLQLLGFEVDNISSVQFSHMGAGRTGSILAAAELKELMDGLEGAGMLGQYTHILTGWAGEVELLRGIADAGCRGPIRSIVCAGASYSLVIVSRSCSLLGRSASRSSGQPVCSLRLRPSPRRQRHTVRNSLPHIAPASSRPCCDAQKPPPCRPPQPGSHR